MEKRVLLYGGAFDMPHKGHLDVAFGGLNYMMKHYGFDELWFLPCMSNAFGDRKLTDSKHRVKMLELLIEASRLQRFSVCTDEVEMGGGLGVYAVIKKLICLYPKIQFAYLIGLDQALKIRNWRNSRKLVETLPFIVVPRNNGHIWEFDKWYFRKPHVRMKKNLTPKAISSHSMRGYFRSDRATWEKLGDYQQKFLTKKVHKYIIDNDLYFQKEST